MPYLGCWCSTSCYICEVQSNADVGPWWSASQPAHQFLAPIQQPPGVLKDMNGCNPVSNALDCSSTISKVRGRTNTQQTGIYLQVSSWGNAKVTCVNGMILKSKWILLKDKRSKKKTEEQTPQKKPNGELAGNFQWRCSRCASLCCGSAATVPESQTSGAWKEMWESKIWGPRSIFETWSNLRSSTILGFYSPNYP